METNYKSNSHKSKSERAEEMTEKKKEIKKVVKGTVKTKKKNVLKDIFISEDVANVKSYVFMDVLVPAIKKAISDIVTDGIDMILYGETGHKKRSNGNKVSYRSYYEKRDDRRSSRDRDRRSHDYDNVIVNTRAEALEVIESMEDIIEEYGNVSVSDLYELVGIETDNFAYNKFGWTDLRNAEAVRVRDGYLIKLPRAVSL